MNVTFVACADRLGASKTRSLSLRLREKRRETRRSPKARDSVHVSLFAFGEQGEEGAR